MTCARALDDRWGQDVTDPSSGEGYRECVPIRALTVEARNTRPVGYARGGDTRRFGSDSDTAHWMLWATPLTLPHALRRLCPPGVEHQRLPPDDPPSPMLHPSRPFLCACGQDSWTYARPWTFEYQIARGRSSTSCQVPSCDARNIPMLIFTPSPYPP
jgi:hypothetical protein